MMRSSCVNDTDQLLYQVCSHSLQNDLSTKDQLSRAETMRCYAIILPSTNNLLTSVTKVNYNDDI